MNDEKNKLKEAFKLSDLLYLKISRENMSDWEVKLGKIRTRYRHDLGSLSIMQARWIFIERAIKWFTASLPKRVILDLQNVEKVMSPIKKSIYKKIYKRASFTIEQKMRIIEVALEKLCKSIPDIVIVDYNYINRIVNKEKCRLLKNAKIEIEIHQKRFGLKIIGSELSEEQERDYEKYGYNCKDRIYIPGTPSVNRNFIILLNGKETKIKDANFLLLLRFVVELKKGRGGKVHINDLEGDKVIPSRTYYQYIDRLNSDLRINIMFCKDGKKKLIKSVGVGYFQISTHPDFVSYNLENLLNYPGDSQIIYLAKRLEEIEKKL